MYLLALSGLVPIDKCKYSKPSNPISIVIKRMNHMNKWDSTTADGD
jgi:hypothetical protein